MVSSVASSPLPRAALCSEVKLIFPPGWTPFSPYLALPTLKAYLESEGVPTSIEDWNLEFFDELLSEQWLDLAIDRCKQFHRQYDEQAVLGDRDGRHYREVVRALLLSASTNQIQTAKDTFRSQAFYKPDSYDAAKQTIAECLNIASASYCGLKLRFNEISVDSNYGGQNDLLRLLDDRHRNPFIDFVDARLPALLDSVVNGVIGISITSESQLIPALTLCRRIKIAKAPHAHICLGGNYITRLASDWVEPNEIMKLCDSIVLFEGEKALCALAREVCDGGDFQNVPNLMYERGGRLLRNASVTVDIANLPTPSFDGLTLERYLMPEVILPLFTSRSCYAKCSFCTIPYSSGESYRAAKAAKVFSDMKALCCKYDVKLFDLVDETVPLPTMKQLASLNLGAGTEFRWFCETRFTSGYTEDTCQALFNGGCRKLQFGLESYSQRVLDMMQKGMKVEWVQPTLDACMKSGISVHLFFITGFPGETRKEALATIQFTEQVLHRARTEFSNPHWTRGWGLFSLEKFSDVYNKPDKYGIEIHHDRIGALNVGRIPYSTLTGMSVEEAANIVVASHRDTREYLSERGWFAFHTHDFNLNSEEESFLRICHGKLQFASRGANICGERIRQVLSIKHPFLHPTRIGKIASYEPRTRIVADLATNSPDEMENEPVPTWLFINGADRDWYIYDLNSGRKIRLDRLTFAFLRSLAVTQSASAAIYELERQGFSEISETRLRDMVRLGMKHGVIRRSTSINNKEYENGKERRKQAA